jgi:hypothetical protein
LWLKPAESTEGGEKSLRDLRVRGDTQSALLKGVYILLGYFLVIMFGIIVSLIFGIILKKLFPKIYGVLTGGRV